METPQVDRSNVFRFNRQGSNTQFREISFRRILSMSKEMLQHLRESEKPSPFNSGFIYAIGAIAIAILLFSHKTFDIRTTLIFLLGAGLGFGWSSTVWRKRFSACTDYLDEEIRTRRTLSTEEETRIHKSSSAICQLLYPFIFVKQPSKWQIYFFNSTVHLPHTAHVIRLINQTLTLERHWRTDKLWQREAEG